MPDRKPAKPPAKKRPPRVTAQHAANAKAKRGKPKPEMEVLPPVYLEPWEKQPGEAMERYEAFLIYRDQLTNGALRRGLERVGHACGKHPSLMERWSREDHWRERAAAWDRHLQAVRDAAKVAAVEAVAQREVQQIAAAAQTLQAPIVALLTRISEDAEYLKDLTAWQLTRLALAAAKGMPMVIQGERLVHGLSTSNVDLNATIDDARRQAEAMTTVERERLLLGEGVDDGRQDEREEAARRAASRLRGAV